VSAEASVYLVNHVYELGLPDFEGTGSRNFAKSSLSFS